MKAIDISSPVIRYHGGKFRLATWIIKHFPAHTCYVEPFGGAAGVLMRKPRSYAEVYNDIDGQVVNLFRVIRNDSQLEALISRLSFTPYARAEFELAWEPCDDPIEMAARLIVRAQMGFSSAGATCGLTGFRTDTRRSYGTAQHLWTRFPNSLRAVGERLAGVLVENRPGLDVMAAHDMPTTLHYVDPPYLHQTRVRGQQPDRYYAHEMSDEQHMELLCGLKSLKGMVVLSGYRSELYQSSLADWTLILTKALASGQSGNGEREECLWLNPACSHNLTQLRLPLEWGVPA
ncbi:DNA adenine methylase [Pseudomonas benzopyrenica]|uniref:DNA adenine methylase n=1 Tax=Pseudomonas benzopyrenica TaxID=2993566 RepID=A0ABZ2FMI8_9PSED